MCEHKVSRKEKIIKLKNDRYFQVIKFCTECQCQLGVNLTELKQRNFAWKR